jgi:hypothetical protein
MSKSLLPLLLGSLSAVVFAGVAFAEAPGSAPDVAGNWAMSIPGKNRTMT